MGQINEYDKVTTVANNDTFLLEGADGTKGITGENLAKSIAEMSGIGEISKYDKVTTVENSDIFLLEGADGIKGITAENLSKSIVEMANITPDLYAMVDKLDKPELHRNIFRGKNLGTTYADTQKSQVAAGTFKDLFLGDYWEIEGFVWRIVDINYWLRTGPDNKICDSPHLVIMPDKALYNAKMNETAVTTYGYVGSQMYTNNIDNAKTMANSAFGSANVLNHREYLTNAVTNGYPSAGSWYESTIELPNEIMMYGSHVFAPAGDGSFVPARYTIDKTQLALMKMYPRFINPARENQWLRDVVSSAYFARVNGNIRADCATASDSLGVRPVFGLIG